MDIQVKLLRELGAEHIIDSSTEGMLCFRFLYLFSSFSLALFRRTETELWPCSVWPCLVAGSTPSGSLRLCMRVFFFFVACDRVGGPAASPHARAQDPVIIYARFLVLLTEFFGISS